MEARKCCLIAGMATMVFASYCSFARAQILRSGGNHVAESQNFIVFASSPQWAKQVSDTAERQRRELALYWLGEELPPWSQRCPIHVQAAPNLGAGGETRFSLMGRSVGNWMMSVQGTPERVLDSVLPHELTHTIFATHFAPIGKYVPRWADEGACTTVEHEAEKRKHRHFLVEFLKTGRGLAFNNMFQMREYPSDILPLYAQGHSAVQFLLDQGGPREFVAFLEDGMRSDSWDRALADHYAYETIGEFQTNWNMWLADHSPADLINYSPKLQKQVAAAAALASNDASPQRGPNAQFAIGNAQAAAPVQLASGTQAGRNRLDAANESVLPSDPVSLASAVPSSAPKGTMLGDDSWYQRRLIEVSGKPATPVPAHNIAAMQQNKAASQQHFARPMAAQSNGIQVLDWGDSQPVTGIESTVPAAQNSPGSHAVLPPMVPIYR